MRTKLLTSSATLRLTFDGPLFFSPMSICFTIASRPSVLRRGLTYSVVVGTILVAINQGDAILGGNLSAVHLLKVGLTFTVPFMVSTLSSVSAIRERENVRNA